MLNDEFTKSLKDNIRFRRAVPEDAEAIARMEKECFSEPWSFAAVEEELINPIALYICAAVENDLAGYAGVQLILDEAYITNIAVSKKYRMQGIGEKLMERLIAAVREKDAAFITLEVRKSNFPAMALYEKLGFKAAGERKNYYVNPTENAVIMTRYLKGGEEK